MVFRRKIRALIIDVVSIISPSKISDNYMPEHIIFVGCMRRDFWQIKKITKVISLSFEIVMKIREQRSGLI